MVIKNILTIAGSDPSGGAGIQADLKTIANLKCYGMAVITALTAQNTTGVTAIHSLPSEFVARQIKAIKDDIMIDAIKIGMVERKQIVKVIVRSLFIDHPIEKIVLDPVFIAKSGHRLLKKEDVYTLIDLLFPYASLVTPNIPEAEDLTGLKINNYDDMVKAAEKIILLGAKAVLIKGGHLLSQDKVIKDLFLTKSEIKWFEAEKIHTKNTHGTGCTLSSAIASYYASYELSDAIGYAKSYLAKALKSANLLNVGKGIGPLNHNVF